MALVVLLLVVGLSAVALVAYAQYRRRQARVGALLALAQCIGFTFTVDDVDHVLDLPFGLFRRGDGRKLELVLSGTHNGLPLRLFDYWYYDETSDGHGGRSRSYHRFTCGILTVPAACPHLWLGHEGFFSHLGSHLGLRDVELESDEFNRRFRVKCDDQKFAFSVLDGRMMEWLLAADSFDTVEIVGPWVLLAVGKLDPARWLDVGSWLDAFHAHVPQVVYSTYPPR